MTASALSAVLVLAIAGVLAVKARTVIRSEKNDRPGSVPGKGHHILRSEYFSGGGGGGETMEYAVPKDPQAYARLFVPKDKGKARK